MAANCLVALSGLRFLLQEVGDIATEKSTIRVWVYTHLEQSDMYARTESPRMYLGSSDNTNGLI